MVTSKAVATPKDSATPKTPVQVAAKAPIAKPTPKLAAKPTAKKIATPAAPAAAAEPKLKTKLVRDSFTIPKPEYAVMQGLKLRAANLKHPIKKSELLRAGIAALRTMDDKAFLAALNVVPSLKTGRPKTKALAKTVTKATAKSATKPVVA